MRIQLKEVLFVSTSELFHIIIEGVSKNLSLLKY